MKISVSCEKCGKKLKAPESLAGKRAKCSQCGAVINIPKPQEKLDDTGFELEIIEDEAPKRSKPVKPAAAKTPPPTPALDPDSGPLDLLDDLLEPELPPSALVEHDANAGAPAGGGRGRGKGGGGGAAAAAGAGRPDTGTSSIMARAAANDKRYAGTDGPQPWFSLMGIDFTPVKSIVLLVIVTLLLGGSIYYFTGPGKGVRIYEVKPVTALIAMNTLGRQEVKGMAGISIGQQGVKPPVSPLGSQFAEERYGLGGPDRLIFTRPDPNGDYLLVHVKISQRVVAEERLENRYDAMFTANSFLMHIGNEEIKPMLIMGQMPNEPFEINTGGAKVDHVQGMLPADVEPDEYNNLVGEPQSITSADLVYNGQKGVTGQVSVSSNRKQFDQPGVTGIVGRGELVQKDPYSGTTLKYEYLGGDMRISWNGPATAWWSSDQYIMPAAISPFARYDIYLLYPRPKTNGSMVIKVNNRTVGTLSSSLAAKDGQSPSTVATAGVPAAAANPTVNTQDQTPTTPEEAAKALAGGPGGTGGKPAAGSPNTGGSSKAADPGMFDYFGALARARDMGKGVVAENNMKQLGMGVLMYAEANGGKLPPDIDHLRTVLGDINKLLENVRTNSNPGFLYIQPAANVSSVSNPQSTPILYELRDGKLDRDGAIMYLDGHIELPKK